jgi:type II secretory pathway component GspD/PulD (secretin)
MKFSTLVFFAALTLNVAAQAQIKIFTLSNRPAAATVDIVQALLQPGESVWAEERLQRLIVKAAPQRLEEVRKLLEQIDLPAPQVWLHVQQFGSRPFSGSNAGVGVTAGGHIVGGANSYDVQHTVSETQKLLVMSGEKGHITVGEDIPIVQPYWTYASGLGLVAPNVVWQRVSTGFAVEPTVVGSTIRLRIIPWLSYLSPQGNGQIEFSESATSLTLENGASATISSSSGGNSRSGTAFGLIFGGTASQQQSSSGGVVVRAVIQE